MNYLPNVNAERAFEVSGLPDTETIRRAVHAEAGYTMNHVACRFSSAVQMACGNLKNLNLGSDIARGILAKAEDIRNYADGDQGFLTWLALVDGSLRVRLGAGLFDLEVEDYPLREAYESRENPIEIAIEIALEQGWEG